MPSPIAKRTESQTSTPKLDRNQAKVKHSLARKRGNKHLSFLLLIHNGGITFFVKSQSSVSRFSHLHFLPPYRNLFYQLSLFHNFSIKRKENPSWSFSGVLYQNQLGTRTFFRPLDCAKDLLCISTAI